MKQQPKEPDQLTRFGQELKNGEWFGNAQKRAQRRKSAWNLLLPAIALPLFLIFSMYFIKVAWLIHLAVNPDLTGAARQFPKALGGGAILIVFSSLMAAVCPALIVTNFIVYRIPPARKAMDLEDRGYTGVDYVSSQRALAKFGAILFVAAGFLALLGVFLKG